jgi:hypothetical protein
MTTGFSQDLAPFDVARILGTSALKMLVCAHVANEQREALAKEVNEEPSGRTYATAGVTGTKLRGSEETLRRHLFPAAMLYQSSMEAKLKLAADLDANVKAAIAGKGYFAPRWIAALSQVNQPLDEFEKYADILYRGVRNPVVHLYDDTKAEKNLVKINAVSFEAIYTGVRYGWWAYTRLLYGLGLVDGNLRKNWETICFGVGLIPDLYEDSMPVATV